MVISVFKAKSIWYFTRACVFKLSVEGQIPANSHTYYRFNMTACLNQFVSDLLQDFDTYDFYGR